MNLIPLIINSLFQLINYGKYRKFLHSTFNVAKAQEKVLKNIILKNKNCEYGKKYNFQPIKSLEEFTKNIPETNYEDYLSYIQKIKTGNKNV